MVGRRAAIALVLLVAGCGADAPKPTEVVAPIVPVIPAPGFRDCVEGLGDIPVPTSPTPL